jgi:hypothetical protein
MSQNQEIIESKLCAYIDDELDPEGRAEIEKHLEANPQHRRLLESLRATRDLIRWLPREQAPPEISETLNGQLERSVLLEYGDNNSMRISRAPRIFAAAAIIALTAGLGAAVYYALPRSQKPAVAYHGTESAKSSSSDVVPSATTPADPEMPLRPEADRDLRMASKMKATDEKTEVATAQPRPDMAKNLAERESVAPAKQAADLDQLARDVAANPAVFANAVGNSTRNLAESNPMGSNAVVMLVRSDVPERAEKQLTTYLDSKQIQWRQTQLSQQGQLAFAGGQAEQSQSSLNGGGAMRARNEVSASSGSLAEAKDAAQSQRYASKGGDAGKPGGLYDAVAAAPINNFADTQPSQPAISAKRALGGAAETQPSLNASNSQYALQQQAEISGNNFNLTANAAYRSNGVYVCQMSRRQAEQLTDTISHTGNQAAELRDVAAIDYPTAEAPNSAISNRVGGEMQQAENGLARTVHNAPTTNPSSDDHILSKASVANPSNELPDRLAAGSARADKSPVTEPAESNGISPNAQSAPAPAAPSQSAPAPPPATPNVQMPVLAAGPTTSPTTQPVADQAVAQAAPTTAAADEPVNVVILVQPNDAVQAAVAPSATQPVTAAPATVPSAPESQPSR